uniref:UDP-glucuronosyltransferase n=1 Tax=Rhabditophanes sp. KR3021 TaxID=114890 RepID=A0AC35UI08_9BILA
MLNLEINEENSKDEPNGSKAAIEMCQAFYYEKSWAFIDYPRFLFTPQPIASDITSVSEVCIDVDEELPLEFKTFMEKPNSKGTIFVAYGNNVYWQQAPENVTTEFLSALEYFQDYQIIWTVRYKGLTTTKSNVKITNWAPQRAILKHNSTVLFLSHCGLKSIKEAVCSEVPLVVSPFFSDQTKNAFELVQNDIAVLISKFEMNRINIVNTLQKVLSNLEHYKKNVIRFKKLFTDNVKNPLEVSSHFIERAIRIKKDTKKFKIAGLFSDFQTTYYFTSIALIYVLICLIASK